MSIHRDDAPSPCIGVCSTGLGDFTCKGCGRYHFDVIRWNSYSPSARLAIEKRNLADLEAAVLKHIYVECKDTLEAAIEKGHGNWTRYAYQPLECRAYHFFRDNHVYDVNKVGLSTVSPNVADSSVLRKLIHKDWMFLREENKDAGS